MALLGVILAACSSDSGSTEALCTTLGDTSSLTAAFEGFDPTDPSAALEQLRPARVTLGELKDAAPEEVRDELQVEIDYIQGLIDALDALPAEAEATEVGLTVQSVTDVHPDVPAAAATLEAFAAAEC